jgi:DNA-nicking Smr family endonuclease
MPPPKKPSDTDHDLFQQAMSDVRPLKKRNARAPEPSPKKTTKAATPPAAPPPHALTIEDVEPLQSGDLLQFARGGVQPNALRNMRRGRIDVGATLDLHGMTAAHAQNELRLFIERCQSQGHRYVRVVHGKGHNTKDAPPVIKSIVNHWLREQPQVLAFCSAPPHDGGVGAVYVMLKTAR